MGAFNSPPRSTEPPTVGHARRQPRRTAARPEGMVRIGLLHYNTSAEVNRLLADLAALEV